MRSLIWKAVGAAATVLSGFVAQKAVEKTWKSATGHTPPGNAGDLDVKWSEAIAWAALSGVIVGIAQLVATRGVAQAQHRGEARRALAQDTAPDTTPDPAA